MSKIDDVGPAFPMATVDGWVQPGMTLRDWFAGHALAGLCANNYYPETSCEITALAAYRLADAMIAEGNKDGAE